MMQTSFYTVSLEEEQALVDFLRQKRDVIIVAYESSTPDLQTSKVMPYVGTNRDFDPCYFWDTANFPPPVNKFIPEHNLYLVDQPMTEAIEFLRCSTHFKDDHAKIAKPGEALIDSSRFALRTGRIAIDHKLWIGDKLVERPTLKKFFEQASRCIKKNSVYSLGEWYKYYVLPSAAEFLEKGGYADLYGNGVGISLDTFRNLYRSR